MDQLHIENTPLLFKPAKRQRLSFDDCIICLKEADSKACKLPLSDITNTKETGTSFDFNTHCIFCSKKSYKKEKQMSKITSKECCKQLEKKVRADHDEILSNRLGDIHQLIRKGAQYHASCYKLYFKDSSPKSKNVNKLTDYDKAFNDLVIEIRPILENGCALDMQEVLVIYQEKLKQYIPTDKAMSYTRHKLKLKLQEKADFVAFYPQFQVNKPDLLVHVSVNLRDVINSAISYKEKSDRLQIALETKTKSAQMSSQNVLYRAASILRSLLKCKGLNTDPLNPSDITMEKARELIDDKLYTFLDWLLLPEMPESCDNISRDEDVAVDMSILSIAQDIIYQATKGRCKTPKHIGLGISMHQITQSKEVVRMLNRLGHSVCYEDVQRIDTTWSEMQLKEDCSLPFNMLPGKVTVGAGDNFNRATSSLDGHHHDVVNMVLFQTSSLSTGTFSDISRKNRKRSVIDKGQPKALTCPNLHGKQPGPTHLLNKVNMDWFTQCTKAHQMMHTIDQCFALLRMMPTKLFDINFEKHQSQSVPGWSVFHAVLSRKENIVPTVIGYCPMLPMPATDMQSIYSMMKYFQKAFASLGQSWTYITYDEAIYSKAQMIKWRNRQEFSNDEMELGGMHRAKNFMGVIGHLLAESGISDILVDSDIYGPSVISNVLNGGSYNRGIRIHKLLNEAFHRLRWEAFETWLENNNTVINTDVQKVAEECIQLFNAYDKTSMAKLAIQSKINDLHTLLAPVDNQMQQFVEESSRRSKTFRFWNDYLTTYSQLLLDFVAATREGDRETQFEVLGEMLPLDFICGHQNYARWGTVNLMEKKLLKETKPEIYEAITTCHSAVNHTPNSFSGVWHDMAIEQSLNRDCGKHQHLVSQDRALAKYYMTAHLKGSVTGKMREMTRLNQHNIQLHKEATECRVAKDEKAIVTICDTVKSLNNPFQVDSDSSIDNPQPLIQLTTSAVAPDDVADSLLSARIAGQTDLQNFLETRINTQQIDFFQPIKKPQLKTFSSMNKPLRTKKNEVVQSLTIDRDIFAKLCVIGQSREIPVRQLMNYELSPVPLSLFHLDGSMRKTNKSAVMTWLENSDTIEAAPDTAGMAFFVDFMMLLHMIIRSSYITTYGDLSDRMFSAIMSQSSRIVVAVADTYKRDSIKSQERINRGERPVMEVRKPTRDSKLPSHKSDILCSQNNKVRITNFVMTDWISNKLNEHQHLLLTGGLSSPDESMLVTSQGSKTLHFKCDHEEADSRIFALMSHVHHTYKPTKFMIWSMDTDVAIMCPFYVNKLGIQELYLKTGIRQHQRYIPMHKVAGRLGDDMSQALPALHALSGSDATSSFHGLGKKRWFTLAENHVTILADIAQLGESPDKISVAARSACSQLALMMYGVKSTSFSDGRYELFTHKSHTSENLPPTPDAIGYHLQRANYVIYIWTHADHPILALPSPEGNGWKREPDGHLVPVLMNNAPAPEAVMEFKRCRCSTGCASSRCTCRKHGLYCTDACGCTDCCNQITGNDSDSDTD